MRKGTQGSLFNGSSRCTKTLPKLGLALCEQSQSPLFQLVGIPWSCRSLVSPSAMMLTRTSKCHEISSPNMNLHVIMARNRLMQEHAATFALKTKKSNTRERIS